MTSRNGGQNHLPEKNRILLVTEQSRLTDEDEDEDEDVESLKNLCLFSFLWKLDGC